MDSLRGGLRVFSRDDVGGLIECFVSGFATLRRESTPPLDIQFLLFWSPSVQNPGGLGSGKKGSRNGLTRYRRARKWPDTTNGGLTARCSSLGFLRRIGSRYPMPGVFMAGAFSLACDLKWSERKVATSRLQ